MNDFDTVNMNKLQKARYYLKEYGLSYTLDRGLKKLGIPVSADLEYTAWKKRRKPSPPAPAASFRILREEDLAQMRSLPAVSEELVIIQGGNTALDPEYVPAVCAEAKAHPKALLFYTDSDQGFGKKRFRPYFRPDYSPELLLCFPYIGPVFAVRSSLLAKLSKTELSASENPLYELLLRLSALLKEDEVRHISFPLYAKLVEKGYKGFWRNTDLGLQKCVERHLERMGWKGTIRQVRGVPGIYHVSWDLSAEPKVSVLIPNKDHIGELSVCLDSLLKTNTYQNLEIVIIENNSTEEETFAYYDSLKDPRIKILEFKGEFNYSAINNFGASNATGELLLLLNNDTQVLAPDSLRELVASALRPGCGASGAMLYYPDGTIQHGGVIIKIGGFAANALWSLTDRDETYFPYSVTAREMTACTAACLMIRREAFDRAGGFDEKLAVALNDVDLCLRIRRAGYKILFNPEARLTHFESKSRGMEDDPKKQERFNREIAYFQETWQDVIDAGDPYYNVNQTLHYANYSLELAEDNRGRYHC